MCSKERMLELQSQIRPWKRTVFVLVVLSLLLLLLEDNSNEDAVPVPAGSDSVSALSVDADEWTTPSYAIRNAMAGDDIDLPLDQVVSILFHRPSRRPSPMGTEPPLAGIKIISMGSFSKLHVRVMTDAWPHTVRVSRVRNRSS